MALVKALDREKELSARLKVQELDQLENEWQRSEYKQLQYAELTYTHRKLQHDMTEMAQECDHTVAELKKQEARLRGKLESGAPAAPLGSGSPPLSLGAIGNWQFE